MKILKQSNNLNAKVLNKSLYKQALLVSKHLGNWTSASDYHIAARVYD
jgi:hypothetical protein